jgi:DNA modification methylase
MKPTWETNDGAIRLYCADCLDVLPTLEAGSVDAVVTDPPYGMSYRSGFNGVRGTSQIVGDESTEARDAVLAWWKGPAIVFGTWKVQRPPNIVALLTWDKGPHVGAGDLSLPWKPNTEEVYVIGGGFFGHRGTSVLQYNAPSPNFVGLRVHPTEKPLPLMLALVAKCPQGTILDPFMGSGTTGVACIRTGRKFIGIEKEERYFDISVRRIQQELERFPLFQEEILPVQGSLLQ